MNNSVCSVSSVRNKTHSEQNTTRIINKPYEKTLCVPRVLCATKLRGKHFTLCETNLILCAL